MSTTIRVSKETLNVLEQLRRKSRAKSLEDVIKMLVKERRRQLIDDAFGVDQGKISSFKEEDRGEDRS